MTDIGADAGTQVAPTEQGQQQAAPAEPLGEFTSAEELLGAYNDLRARVGAQGNEIGQYRSEVERAHAELDQARQMLARMQQPDPQQGGPVQGEQAFNLSPQEQLEWEAWNEHQPFAAQRWLAQQEAAAVFGPMAQAIEQRFEQLSRPLQQISSQSAVQRLIAEHGQEMYTNNRAVIAAAVRDPVTKEFLTVADPQEQFQRLELVLKAAEYDRRNGNGNGQVQQPRDPVTGQFQQPQNVLVEPGSGAGTAPPAEEIDPTIAELRAVAQERAAGRDAFGDAVSTRELPLDLQQLLG